MAQEPLNSPENINLPHGVSGWFQRDFTGSFIEVGDMIVDSFSPTPEFLEHFSYRDGIRALRKRLLTQKSATMGLTLNEPSILNLQRILFGGTITRDNAFTLHEGRQAVLEIGTDDELFINVATMDSKVTVANVVITDVFELSDPTEEFGMAVQGGGIPDVNNRVEIQNTTETTAVSGDTVYVKYTIAETSFFKTEFYGATDTKIEGAFELNLRNQSGGIIQIYDLSSVQISPNGDIALPIDGIQTLPMLLTLQERLGTFGDIYAK